MGAEPAGRLAPGTPIIRSPTPLLIGPNAYVVLFVLATFMGAAITRRAKARWPGISRMDRCPKSAMPHLRNDKQNGGAGVGDLETKYPAQFSSRCS
ncbi:hypothetical protein TUM20985_40020 [Mycobacterium antarcticum]|uniref:hypothetical protein n=1 Tax=unclassified Mycolicibacterium TaxID=2636767 RepID=UPI00239C40E3|nr:MULTISPECIES: hypothetical protein [unclassified Mycolicibacterium]BDX33455.1 hypothetical protein TUM20985_40020 [Mycolicibacterium sp. TUM20985]GLP82932.1 hypothetical protein TUM20984_43520 [Mycolicibacterium sp. TUM20984]